MATEQGTLCNICTERFSNSMQLMEVSDPTNPNYGKHLTREELSAATAPPKEDIDKVSSSSPP